MFQRGARSPHSPQALARAVGLRNVPVHGYAEVDDDLLVAQLDHVGAPDSFVGAVSRWMDG